MLTNLRPLLGGDAGAGDGSVGAQVVEARDRVGKVDDRVGLTGVLSRAMPRGIGLGANLTLTSMRSLWAAIHGEVDACGASLDASARSPKTS